MKNIIEMLHAENDSDDREEARLLLGEAFKRAVQTNMDDQEWDILAEKYLHSTPEVQGLINYVLISVCGMSVPTLIKIAELGDDIVLEEGRALLVNADKAEHADDIDWDERHCPQTDPLAATVTVDHHHPSERFRKALMDFKTADDEGKKRINAEIKDLLGDREIIRVSNEVSQTERMAKLRRERRAKKRARFSVVSVRDGSAS